jgi:hypothetical protein
MDAPDSQVDSLEQFQSIGPSITIPDDLAAELKKILLDTSSYRWGGASGCIPDFGVRIQYQNEGDTFNILFCFECEILEVTKNGKTVGGGDFARSRRSLVHLMRELFPDDNEIQALD